MIYAGSDADTRCSFEKVGCVDRGKRATVTTSLHGRFKDLPWIHSKEGKPKSGNRLPALLC